MRTRSHSIKSALAGLAFGLVLAMCAPSAQANVYASNIKVNGVLKGSASVSQGSSATITYILNEAASLGVTVRILSGATAVRTIGVTAGTPGTLQGLNTVTWDGKNDSSTNVPPGAYTVQVTAAASGYSVWTPIITNSNAKVYWPSGIAVDTRTDSPYYGRVMVANGVNTDNNSTAHPVGIVKFNADGSEADEGQSNAGNPFSTDDYLGDSVRSLKYGTDDRVYFNDWTGNGKCIACDMIMSTNQVILDTALISGSLGYYSDIDITDAGTTNALIWFADGNYPPAGGVTCWPLTNNGVAANVPGIQVLAQGANIPLRTGFGINIDQAGDIFIGEVRGSSGDTYPKMNCITNVFPGVNGAPTNWWNTTGLSYPITSTNLGWQQGAYADDSWLDVADVAIDSRKAPKLVSLAFNGFSGGLKILKAADGTVVTTINQGIGDDFIATGFDAVGNVYAGDASSTSTFWWAFSPPGANQATTPAVVALQVVVQPHITSIVVSGGTATITFTGDPSDPASAFRLLSHGTLSSANSAYTDSGAVITGSGGSYTATVAASSTAQFYRVATVPVTPPLKITSIVVSGGTATIKFTGNPSDPASAFKLLSRGSLSTANTAYTDSGAVITGGGGSYTATVGASGTGQFYRVFRP